MDIYRQEIIDHYQHPRNFGNLKKPTVTHEEANSFCGDKIRMEIETDGDKINDVSFTGVGCAVSVASASFLTEMVKGVKIEKAKKITKEDLVKKIGIELSPTRLKCAWLSFEVLTKALAKI